MSRRDPDPLRLATPIWLRAFGAVTLGAIAAAAAYAIWIALVNLPHIGV